MENVKALVSDKFMPEFKRWMLWLQSLGYNNFTQVMNAKDYGVPQNRERVFMVSVLDDTVFYFPKPYTLDRRLKDVLEANVDESYYLSDEKIQSIIEHCERKQAEGWRDGTAVKSTDCSYKDPEFNSQQLHGGSQPSVVESNALFWCV